MGRTPAKKKTAAKPREPLTQVEVGKRRRAATRIALLDAAFSLLGQPRQRSLQIEDVCTQANVVRGTFYNHFESAETLLEALSYELSHEFNIAVHRHSRQLPTVTEQVVAAIRLYLHRARTDNAWGWAMINISFAGAILGRETHTIVTEDVKVGVLNGDFGISSAKLGADMVLGIGFAGMISILEGGMPDDYPEQVAREIMLALGVNRAEVERIVSEVLPIL